MKCPVDGNELVMSERQNVEIDYCPQCRGVWLDRGELDKIIERLESEGLARSQSHQQADHKAYRETYNPSHQQRHEYHDYDDDDYRRSHHKKHKESWLGDLFD